MANHHLIAYSFSNISAKNYQNRLICVEVIMYNVIVVFLRHSVDVEVLESAAHDEPEGSGEENKHDRKHDAGDDVQLAPNSLSTLGRVAAV